LREFKAPTLLSNANQKQEETEENSRQDDEIMKTIMESEVSRGQVVNSVVRWDCESCK
jgi:hypothetical protein